MARKDEGLILGGPVDRRGGGAAGRTVSYEPSEIMSEVFCPLLRKAQGVGVVALAAVVGDLTGDGQDRVGVDGRGGQVQHLDLVIRCQLGGLDISPVGGEDAMTRGAPQLHAAVEAEANYVVVTRD